ncbi:hypothetical protein [Haliangium ochraceum]|uniref:Lipoprotein n=1 Tax=Haliangium ochraceum (strain DSM 14365 / JCM 11303 / SMP-2) TaxID=502025 RepID=D0LG00_HALO1|nr:hypothetical protein [Haliangium ochraceum]ACY14602.1 hypothetical protein Hoch_2057 [Haliangium ochraceum DSM 14365]
MNTRNSLTLAAVLLGAALLSLAPACSSSTASSSRTTAATQPTPAAFDPGQSDPQALTLADEMIAQLGGAEAWAQVKQIQWDTKYQQNGAFAAWFRHAWDRWNGRHRFESLQMNTYQEAQETGRDEVMKWIIVVHDLFGDSMRPQVTFDGQLVESADRDTLVEQARNQWKIDSYQLTMLHKLRDPGVILSYVGESQDVYGTCQEGCVVIKVSFVPELGEDSYFLNLDKTTKLPQVLEKRLPAGTLAYEIAEWTEAGGLKFPSKLRNIGVSEEISFENLRIGEPDDTLYRQSFERRGI